MVNPHRGQVKLDIGGRERTLRYSLNRLAAIQNRFGGKPLQQIFNELEQMNVEVLLCMLHQGLLDDDKNLTEEAVGDWDFDLQPTLLKVSEALALSLGGSQQNPQNPKAKQLAAKKA